MAIEYVHKEVKYKDYNNDSILKGFAKRSNNPRFGKLRKDEKLIAHWSLAFKELVKYNWSTFYDVDMDCEDLYKQMDATSSDKYGGIGYFNYMFSDSYEKEDKLIDENNVAYANLSISRALEKYGAVAIGDFVCPPELLAYTKEAVAEGKWDPRKNCVYDVKRYEDMKNFAEGVCRRDPNLAGQPILSIAGAIASECGWVFNLINTSEASGGGVAGTGGYSGCGECPWGLTFWNQKIQYIRKLHLDTRFGVSTDPNTYGPPKMIGQLPVDVLGEVLVEYLTNTKSGRFLLDYNKTTKNHNMEDAKNCICASFLFKAGEGGKRPLWWERTLERRDAYWNTHMRLYGHARDIIAEQIYMSMMFARYLKDNKVLKGKHPWE